MVLHRVKDMGSEMFELCDTSHYFVFRLVGSTLANEEDACLKRRMRMPRSLISLKSSITSPLLLICR